VLRVPARSTTGWVAVTIGSIEKYITDEAFKRGWKAGHVECPADGQAGGHCWGRDLRVSGAPTYSYATESLRSCSNRY